MLDVQEVTGSSPVPSTNLQTGNGGNAVPGFLFSPQTPTNKQARRVLLVQGGVAVPAGIYSMAI